MNATEFDTDALLKLLSDALRRGPGSPEWHDAVARFADANGPGADEYRLLLRARERLESGKEYRQVRAGPAFTRSVFERLGEPERHPSDAPRPAVLIGLLCLILILAGGGVLLMHVIQSKPNDAQQAQLDAQLFSVPKLQWTFDDGMPADLKTSGALKLGTRNDALGIVPQKTPLPAEGIVVANDPIDLAAGVCLEAQVMYQLGSTSMAVIASDTQTPQVRGLRSGTQLAVIFDSTGVRCFSPAGITTPPRLLNGGAHTVRLKFLGRAASAEVDGHAIWSGPSPLGASAYPILSWSKAAASQNEAAVRSLSILSP